MAQTEDQVILVMGLDQSQEKERLDRMDLVLPGKQLTLITAVAKAAKRPIVLVLLGGSPMDVTFAKNNRKIGSILWAGYPGQAGATALAQIIFGEHNPGEGLRCLHGGRLPLTWYPQEFTKVPMTDMRMRPQPSIGNPGRTYRFYEGEKVFEFGYGLSYSDYSYAFASVAQNQLNMKDSSNQQSENSKTPGCKLVSDIGEEQCEHIKFKVTVSVKNEGQMAGGGEKTEIEYELSPCEHLSSANEDGVMVMEEGSQILLVGDKEHPVTIIV
ncbi:hypothetical protein NC651_013740 [Populus alba x Populus x berolinensis]|nr:hypothetical protein NC651_013740 [Populus alba x Populus x berolinensis]